MSLLNWTESEILGVKAMDTQHYEIVVLANKLHEKVALTDFETAQTIFTELYNHVKIHFDTENELMKTNKIFEISHKLEHDRYLEKIKNLSLRFKNSPLEAANEFFQSFPTWFHNHSEMNDKKLAKALINLGLS